jgi:hypothetical protein
MKEIQKLDYISFSLAFGVAGVILSFLWTGILLASMGATFRAVAGPAAGLLLEGMLLSIPVLVIICVIGGFIGGFISGLIFAAMYNFFLSKYIKIKAE